MPAVNELAYLLACLCPAVALFLLYKRKWKLNVGEDDAAQNNSEFRSLQRLFLSPYFCVILAENIQAPYLYILYHSYHFVPSQIAVLYVVGLVANVVSSVVLVRLLDRHGHRVLCLLCIAASVVACALKFSSSLPLLLFSRVLDGVAASFAAAPFQHWYVKEHVEHWDFPADWLQSTFSILAVGSAFLAVLAGFVAEAAESSSSITAFPFAVSILLLLAGGAAIGALWSENRSSTEERISKPFAKALSLFKKKPVHALVEAAAQMFVFVWTPLFLHSRPIIHSRLSYGGIYAAFMGASLLGSLIARLHLSRVSSTRLLSASLGSALVSFVVSYSLIPSTTWTVTIFRRLLFSFAVFEFSMGIYGEALSRLQAEVLPGEQRSALLALLRLPLTAVAAGGMLFLHDGTADGDAHLLSLCAFLMLVALVMSLLLDCSLARRGEASTQQDHFQLPHSVAPDAPSSQF